MVKVTDLARELGATAHADVIDAFKEQLLLVAFKRLKRAGQTLDFPVVEVDDTSQDLLSFKIVNGVFHFELSKKA